MAEKAAVEEEELRVREVAALAAAEAERQFEVEVKPSLEERAAALPPTLERYTATTITEPKRLVEELARIREDGWAVCVGELEESLFGASAALLSEQSRPIAIVSVWGTEHRLPRERLPEIGRQARAQPGEIVRRLQPEPGIHEQQLHVGVGVPVAAEVGQRLAGGVHPHQVGGQPLGRLDREHMLNRTLPPRRSHTAAFPSMILA